MLFSSESWLYFIFKNYFLFLDFFLCLILHVAVSNLFLNSYTKSLNPPIMCLKISEKK